MWWVIIEVFYGTHNAKVLARFILDQPATVAKKKVLDLGSGCGAVSIAAKRRVKMISISSLLDR